MKIWQVAGWGEGFVREGKTFGFELSGFISANGPTEAFKKAVLLAKHQYPELSQAEIPDVLRPVINADEVEEVTGRLQVAVDEVEVFWSEQPNVGTH